ncbi:MAG: hypothetical protein CM15mP125_2060 [Gammaproteobacteria bacterium]|nr:MAG: hypothetical protein CM15mP125_2060 [Gammaproteobacteria bacterium]
MRRTTENLERLTDLRDELQRNCRIWIDRPGRPKICRAESRRAVGAERTVCDSMAQFEYLAGRSGW